MILCGIVFNVYTAYFFYLKFKFMTCNNQKVELIYI
nr:MAG TPA: hypothetical protein [Caudoviricetes sp.]